ncbi:MAG: hypothetical protein ACOYZ8_11775 [Chloroflexota bacterium]
MGYAVSKNEKAFDILVGTELSSVEFVRDYLQLRFDGPCLNVLTDPVLTIDNKEYKRIDFGFCDRLCQFIGKQVVVATIDKDKILLGFSEERKIVISLKEEDRKTDEAAIFYANKDQWWVW